jgi:hypothetical protein
MKRLFFVILVLAAALTRASAADAPGLVWESAVVTSVSAVGDMAGGGFTLYANVELPQPKACYTALRFRSDGLAPMHYIVQQARNEKICTEVITPYNLAQHFYASPIPLSVVVSALDEQHKRMNLTVRVPSRKP